MLQWIRERRNKKTEKNSGQPMHQSNILLISSSATELFECYELLESRYQDNSEPMRLDNGDFAMVIKKKGD